MKYISLICARGGSKGFPNKNIYNFHGAPLIVRAIEIAMNNHLISRVIVSTDSKQIAKIASDAGAEVPFIRPAELAKDDSPEWLVWRHAVDYLENDGESNFSLVVLPTTAPLRNQRDIDLCIAEFDGNDVDSVITVTEANRSPYFNMIKSDAEGFSSLVIKSDNKVSRRQDVPEVFDMTTVAYVVSPASIKSNTSLFDGKVRSVFIPKERAIDVDTPLDMQMAEFLFKKNEDMI